MKPISCASKRGAERHRAQLLARLEDAVDDADERDDAAVLVVRRVEDSARGGASGSPAGGGIRSMIASSTASTPWPVFAEMRSTRSARRRRSGRRPRRAAPSGSACGRSILLTTGTISRLFSIAR